MIYRPKHTRSRSAGSWAFLVMLALATGLAVWAAVSSTPSPMP